MRPLDIHEDADSTRLSRAAAVRQKEPTAFRTNDRLARGAYVGRLTTEMARARRCRGRLLFDKLIR
jgi:hypothetical protein